MTGKDSAYDKFLTLSILKFCCHTYKFKYLGTINFLTLFILKFATNNAINDLFSEWKGFLEQDSGHDKISVHFILPT